MLKLLFRLRLSKKGRANNEALVEVDRPILWPVCPRIGETVWVSKTTDLAYGVVEIEHWPAGGQIEIFFETDNPSHLTSLLEEENGGWMNGDEPKNWSDIVWPKLEDHPTATV